MALTGNVSIENEVSLTGTIKPVQTLRGKISNQQVSLTAKVYLPTMVDAETYDGDYVVTPKAEESQVLETKNKKMKDDVVIDRIPYWQVDNEFGGATFIIG